MLHPNWCSGEFVVRTDLELSTVNILSAVVWKLLYSGAKFNSKAMREPKSNKKKNGGVKDACYYNILI